MKGGTMSKDFRKEVKIRLIRKGWTQADLADALGLSAVYVNMLLRGVRKNPEQIKRIKEALEIK